MIATQTKQTTGDKMNIYNPFPELLVTFDQLSEKAKTFAIESIKNEFITHAALNVCDFTMGDKSKGYFSRQERIKIADRHKDNLQKWRDASDDYVIKTIHGNALVFFKNGQPFAFYGDNEAMK
jgi:hypothetical protein